MSVMVALATTMSFRFPGQVLPTARTRRFAYLVKIWVLMLRR